VLSLLAAFWDLLLRILGLGLTFLNGSGWQDAEGFRKKGVGVVWLLDEHLIVRSLRGSVAPVDLGSLVHLALVLGQAVAPTRLTSLTHLALLRPVLGLLRQVAERVVADHVEAPGALAGRSLVHGVEAGVPVLLLLMLRVQGAAVGELGVVRVRVVRPGVVLLEHAVELGARGVLVHGVGGAVGVLDVDAVVGLLEVMAVAIDALAVGVRAVDLDVFACAGGVLLVVLELEFGAVLRIGLLAVSVAEAIVLLEVVRVELGLTRATG
jgi:hypothetical protein